MGRTFDNVDYVSFINKTSTSATTQTITSISLANPGVITVVGHGLLDGASIVLALTDSTPVLDGTHTVNVIDEDTFDVGIETTVGGTTGTLQSEFGTDSLPRHVTYYNRPRLLITSITLASPGIVTTSENHLLVTGEYTYLSGTDSTPSINGGRIVTVLSPTTFSVGVDTTGAGTANTGFMYNESFTVKDVFIDSYDTASNPTYLGVLLKGQKFNLGEGHFTFSSNALARVNDLKVLPLIDSRFSTLNITGHSTILPATIADINDSGNADWIYPSTATTLSIVSTTIQDAPGGTGLTTILLQGLDANLNEIVEVVVLNGTTPVITSLSFRSMHLSIALGAGADLVADGTITITGTAFSDVWAAYLPNDSTAETGRYIVPAGKRVVLIANTINGGQGSDMTAKFFVIFSSTSVPISLGEAYVSQFFQNTAGISLAALEAGTCFKWRGFTNSGNPATRKISMGTFAVIADVAAWDSLVLS